MVRYEASASIRAAVSDVWGVLVDVESWPAWLPTVHSVEALDGPGLRAGARYKVTQPKLPPAVWQVTLADPSRGFTWESHSPGTHIVAEHIVAAEPDGGTALLLRLSFDGIVGQVVGRMSRKTSGRYLAQEAVALKKTVERAVAVAA
jgi:uncharacterized membrane protein